MKFGEMKYDVPLESFNKDKHDFTKFEYWKIKNEGKRLYKRYPRYEYLKEDPYLIKDEEFDDRRFYESVVYAYIIENLLKQHPELNEMYREITQKDIQISKEYHREPAEKTYSSFNIAFLIQYQHYLRERTNPGILERERKEKEQEQENLQIAHDMRKMQAKIQTQQDLASGKRVVCPYCKSTNTEKIGTLNRAVSVSLVGVASSKLGKQWHCNNCKSDF